jgi:hypothetical protein
MIVGLAKEPAAAAAITAARVIMFLPSTLDSARPAAIGAGGGVAGFPAYIIKNKATKQKQQQQQRQLPAGTLQTIQESIIHRQKLHSYKGEAYPLE